MPPEIIRLIMSFARPLRPYIHELKYYFVYKNCTMMDYIVYNQPQPYKFETGDTSSEEYSSDEDSSHEEVILPKIKPVYEKGFLGQIKNWISTDDGGGSLLRHHLFNSIIWEL